MTDEIWRDIEGYEGHYQVSNKGNVRSLNRTLTNKDGVKRNVKGRSIRPVARKSGHLAVLLCLDAVQKWHLIHRLVAKAFIPTDDDSLFIDHMNGIPYDNRVENLRWTTPKGNVENRERLRSVPRDIRYKPKPSEEIENLAGEEWRPVVGFEGSYEVSNKGRVKSLDRVLVNKNGIRRNYHGRLISPSILKTGYYEVQLSLDGKVTFKRIHQLVADAFLEPDPNPERTVIDHVNGVKTDNRPENLRWATPKENYQYAIDIGLIDMEERREISRRTARKTNLGKIAAKPVVRSDGKRFESATEAAKYMGVRGHSVMRAANGSRTQCHGFAFKYIDDGETDAKPIETIADLPGETWKRVDLLDGRYRVSNMGRVKRAECFSTDKNGVERFLPEALIGYEFSTSGRCSVLLRANGKSVRKCVDELVASAFLGDRGKGQIIVHMNGDAQDCRLQNLRYEVHQRKRKKYKSKYKPKPNQIDRRKPVMRSDGVLFESAAEAARVMGARLNDVARVARGDRRSFRGYGFKYVNCA